MKKMIIALIALLTITVSASAMSYNQARDEALFLTDKMAYELNLTDEQYEAAYEINLDYLMSIDSYDNLFGVYWNQRNLDLQYVLLDWQYRAFLNCLYFYRPIYWDGGYWHFRIYARYPHRNYFYFGRPRVYVVYRGGHSWRHNGGRSWYANRTWRHHNRVTHVGMRDGWNNGKYGRGQHFDTRDHISTNRNNRSNANRSFGGLTNNNNRSNPSLDNRNGRFGNRESSTRSTVTRGIERNTNRNYGNFSNRSNENRSNANRSFGGSTVRSGSFGGSRVNSNIGSSRSSSESSSKGHAERSSLGGGHR